MLEAHLNYYGGPVNTGSGDILDIRVPGEAWDDGEERTLSSQEEYVDDGLEESVFRDLCEMAVACMEALAPKLVCPVELKLSDVSCYDVDNVVITPKEGEVDDEDGFFYEGEFRHGKDLKHCAGNVSAFVWVM